MNLHLIVIPLLPLAGAAINGLLGKRFPRWLVATVALTFTAASFAWAAVAAISWVTAVGKDLPGPVPYVEHFATWLQVSDFHAEYGFYLDQLSMVMMLIVTGVGFLIHIYSVGYMWEEGGFYRFFSYLNLFMFFMLTLVMAANIVVMFVGWEGVGLCSYLLIGFWFLKLSATNAGKKAFIVTRLGDFGFTVGILLLFWTFHSVDFDTIFTKVSENSVSVATLTSICFLLFREGGF